LSLERRREKKIRYKKKGKKRDGGVERKVRKEK